MNDMNDPRNAPPNVGSKLWGLFTALLFTVTLSACSNLATPQPATPTLTLSEPVACTYGQDDCTVMVKDGHLSLAGSVSGSVAKMSYALNEGAATPVALSGDAFNLDIPDLPVGGNTITITIEGEGVTVVIIIIVINNPGADGFDPDELTVYVSNNGPDNRGNIDVFNERFELQSVFMGGNNEGVEVDRFGNVYQAGDTDSGPSIRVISQLYTRENLAFDPALDREIKGDKTGLVAPKGIDLAEDAGLIIAADFGAGDLKVFNASADGNVAPVATIALDTPAWDVVYDPAADRLFAALTDGTVGVFDAYLESYGAGGPDRVVTPARDGAKMSDNLHGIAYDFASDTLVVTDVGAATTSSQPGFKNDGSIYVLENASRADGKVTPRRVVEGRWTLLGNPVDIILNGKEARVAEKAGDFLLVFDDIFDPNSATLPDEVMPDLVKTEIKPESLVAAPPTFADPGGRPGDGFSSDFDLNVYLSNNGPDNAGDLDTFDELFKRLETFRSGNNEGVDLDLLGNLYHAGDGDNGPSLRIVSQIRNRDDGGMYQDNVDREIKGDKTGLVAPKGFDIADGAGYLIVADFGDKNLKVYGSAAGGNAPPVAMTHLPVAAWDVAYDPMHDRLFAAMTDGTVGVFDKYLEKSFGKDGPTKIITPVAGGGKKISTNLHGIAYAQDRDTLVVTDVGDATVNDDGSIYVINNASRANGKVRPERVVSGAATLLGNPVDIVLNGDEARIAEKARDKLLIFADIFDGASGNVAPDLVVDKTKPESLVAENADFRLTDSDVTDVDDGDTVIDAVFATSNTPDAGNDFVVGLEPDLSAQSSTFDTTGATVNPENITFDLSGDAYLTFDNGMTPSQGGILVVNRLAGSRDGGKYDSSRDRTITGDQTGLVAPKGLDIVDTLGIVIVADFGAKNLKVFSTQTGGNVAPLYVTDNLGSDTRSVWDLDYDPKHDRLFVAATDGTVLVYSDYTANKGTKGPNRVITPTYKGKKVSVNLHGVVHVQNADVLILADVGDAASNADGQIFTLSNAARADGDMAVTAQIGGPKSTLGNPVDITFDGDDLYVAEKTKDTVLRFDDILGQTGQKDVSPDKSVMVDNVESVALAPEYLSDFR